MKFKKAVCVMIIALTSLCFSGCSFSSNTDELVAPPNLTGEMYPIGQALKESAKDYELKYPSSGEYRSAIVLKDIDSDGTEEAFAFYSTNEDELTNMHINVICGSGEEWSSVDDQSIVAIGVENVDFYDLDADGTEEIIVGWQVNGNSDKQLSAYSLENGTLVQKFLQPYTGYLCCDLDSNGVNEIFIHQLNSAQKINKAMVYTFDQNGTVKTSGCMLDGGVKSASAPILSTLSSGQTAIYIDEIKGVGAVTEVVYLSKGQLVNPLLDSENTFENIITLRAAALQLTDINNDSLLEIPVASDLPNAGGTEEKLYYTNWCTFNGEVLTVKLVTVVNTVDGYYLSLPNKYVGNIAVLKDLETHKREFYLYNGETAEVGEKIFDIVAVSVSEWKEQNGKTVIARTEDTVFAAQTYGESITIQEIIDMFNIVI